MVSSYPVPVRHSNRALVRWVWLALVIALACSINVAVAPAQAAPSGFGPGAATPPIVFTAPASYLAPAPPLWKFAPAAPAPSQAAAPPAPQPEPAPAPTVTPAPGAPQPTPTPTATPTATPKPPLWRKVLDRFQPGVRLGESRFLSGKSRRYFGDSSLSLRPSYWRLRPGPARGTFSPDYDLNYGSHNSHRLFQGLLGVNYRRALFAVPGSSQADIERPPTQLYLNLSLGLAPTSIHSRPEHFDSGLRAALQGTVEVGFLLRKKYGLRAAYTGVTRVEGYDLSAFNVGGEVKF